MAQDPNNIILDKWQPYYNMFEGVRADHVKIFFNGEVVNILPILNRILNTDYTEVPVFQKWSTLPQKVREVRSNKKKRVKVHNNWYADMTNLEYPEVKSKSKEYGMQRINPDVINVTEFTYIFQKLFDAEDLKCMYIGSKDNYIYIPEEILTNKMTDSNVRMFSQNLRLSGLVYSRRSNINRQLSMTWFNSKAFGSLKFLIVDPIVFVPEQKLKITKKFDIQKYVPNSHVNYVKASPSVISLIRIMDTPIKLQKNKNYHEISENIVTQSQQINKLESMPLIQGSFPVTINRLNVNTSKCVNAPYWNKNKSLLIACNSIMSLRTCNIEEGGYLPDVINGVMYTCDKDEDLVSLIIEMAELRTLELFPVLSGDENFIELKVIWVYLSRIRDLIFKENRIEYTKQIMEKYFKNMHYYIEYIEIFSKLSHNLIDYVIDNFQDVSSLLMDEYVIELINSDNDPQSISDDIMIYLTPKEIEKVFLEYDHEQLLKFISSCHKAGKKTMKITMY